MKIVYNILISAVLSIFVMGSTGIGVYKYYCNFEHDYRHSIFDESDECSDHHAPAVKSCCQKSDKSANSCSLEKSECCSQEYSMLKIDDTFIGSSEKILISAKYVVLLADVVSLNEVYSIKRKINHPLKMLPVKEVFHQTCVLLL